MSRAIHKTRGGGGLKIVGSVLGNVNSSNQTTHSLGTVDVGPASSDKNIILGITVADDAPRTISSFTVGGVSLAEKVISRRAAALDLQAAIWAGDISSISGSQAISVTFNSQTESSGVSGVAVSGLLSLTPTMSDTANSGGSLITITGLAALADGIAFGVGVGEDPDNGITWGALTEKVDVQTAGGVDDHRHGLAWELGLRAAADATFNSSASGLAVSGAGFR